ncbi:MBL fold metallo-hydrolase [Actinomadura sp. DC4]|uniref:MBL fold metallo-hydrolase n=1 Tax=Actinomadura sp. DC4 TaxID=3055069 RepID=UPI0025B07FD9|nr:MBL fold metallo-hydrolase [Actinomadura sp. DC4]MDN3359664.1 MBL fold metallo-hydrolase [Actinomadura sp. DC4]
MERITIGDIEIQRVIEWRGPISTVAEILPDTPPEVWAANRSWLSPDFWNPETDAYEAVVQTWVLRSGGRTILIDTGVGNGRDRPQIPQFAHLQTDFPDRLAAAGVRPEDVDVVVNTHIHYDHVGWNTRRDGDAWVPAFPNATYLVSRADHDYYDPVNAARMRPPRDEDERRRFTGMRLIFEDSIAPIAAAGRLRLWEDGLRIDDALRIEPAPGHTPGSAVVWAESRGERAVFVGDVLHSPVQILRPAFACRFDLDADQARVSRRRVLEAAARTDAMVFPAHFGGSGAVAVEKGPDPDAFRLARWADLKTAG